MDTLSLKNILKSRTKTLIDNTILASMDEQQQRKNIAIALSTLYFLLQDLGLFNGNLTPKQQGYLDSLSTLLDMFMSESKLRQVEQFMYADIDVTNTPETYDINAAFNTLIQQ